MRILYLMHVNWSWIRQRPHVIAEELGMHHELHLMHFVMYHSKHSAAELKPPFWEKILWRVPERILRWGFLLEYMNEVLLRRQFLSHFHLFKPDMVWVTHPVFEPSVRYISECPVVYDCMDDYLAFNISTSNQLAESEKRLVQQARLTIFSSQTLANRVNKRSPVRSAEIVNNGVANSLLQQTVSNTFYCESSNRNLIFGYFGTISSWFDWALMMHLLENLPDARLRVAGPVETAIPKHPRIEYLGILRHEELPNFVSRCNVLIMPFIVNHLVEAVDPVKLYEYIAYGLPVLAPRYAETERFATWVKLYDNSDEAVSICNSFLDSNYQLDLKLDRHAFLVANSWRERYRQIDNALRRNLAMP